MPAIFRIIWEETPENNIKESNVVKAGYFNLDFDCDDFQEFIRGYIADSVALRTVRVLSRLCYNDIHFLECVI